MLPFGDSFRLYGKAGVQVWALVNNVNGIDDDAGGGPYVGGGLSLDIGETLSLTLDYDRYELEEKAEMISAGLQYNF